MGWDWVWEIGKQVLFDAARQTTSWGVNQLLNPPQQQPNPGAANRAMQPRRNAGPTAPAGGSTTRPSAAFQGGFAGVPPVSQSSALTGPVENQINLGGFSTIPPQQNKLFV